MANDLIPYQDIERMGAVIAKSGLFGMKTPESAVALMLVAQAQGRHPATVAMEYDVIQNRPALKSQAALMRFQEAGGKIKYLVRTDERVSAEFSHEKGGALVVTWDMARARKMGLDQKDNWKKQPMIMLQWRVVAEGVRACYPACLGGSYLVEEVRDFDDKPKPRQVRETTAEVIAPETHAEPPKIEAAPPPAQTMPPLPPGPLPYPAEAPAPKNSNIISEAQRKRLFAISKEAGKSTEQVKAILAVYGYGSTTDIARADYELICNEIQVPAGTLSVIPEIPPIAEQPLPWEDPQPPRERQPGED